MEDTGLYEQVPSKDIELDTDSEGLDEHLNAKESLPFVYWCLVCLSFIMGICIGVSFSDELKEQLFANSGNKITDNSAPPPLDTTAFSDSDSKVVLPTAEPSIATTSSIPTSIPSQKPEQTSLPRIAISESWQDQLKNHRLNDFISSFETRHLVDVNVWPSFSDQMMISLGMNKMSERIMWNQLKSYITNSKTSPAGIEYTGPRRCVAVSLFAHTIEKFERYKTTVRISCNRFREAFPTWEYKIWYDSTIPESFIEDLRQICGEPFNSYKMPKSMGRSGCFWRYEALAEGCDLAYFRDIEMNWNIKELVAIKDFIHRPETVGYMQVAHPRNACNQRDVNGEKPCLRKVLGGLYLMKNTPLFNLSQASVDFPSPEQKKRRISGKDIYGADEIFLSENVHPNFKAVMYWQDKPEIKDTLTRGASAFEEVFVNLGFVDTNIFGSVESHVIDEVKKMELTDYYRRRNLRHDFRFERTFCNNFSSMCVSEI